MIDDSNNPGGGGGDDDPLSKLFDLDEEVTSAGPTHDPFTQRTMGGSDATEVMGSPVDGLDDPTELMGANSPVSKATDSLAGILGPSGSSAPKSDPTKPEDDFGDNLFDGILDDEEIPDETINFFSDNADSTATGVEDNLDRTQVISQNPFVDSKPADQTIVLQKAAEEVLNESSDRTLVLSSDEAPSPNQLDSNNADAIDDALADFEDLQVGDQVEDSTQLDIPAKSSTPPPPVVAGPEVDPVDEALAAFVDGDKDIDIPSTFQEAASPSVGTGAEPTVDAAKADLFEKDLFSDSVDAGPAAAPSATEADFADVFEAGPIEVPEVQSAQRSGRNRQLKKITAIAASVLVSLGGLGGVYYFFSLDEGLFGYRIDGFSIVNAYRPPDSVTQNKFATVFQKTRDAIRNDETQKVEENISNLKGILVEDVRNFESAGLLVESYGFLMRWQGVSGETPQLFDQFVNQLPEISSKLKTTQNWAPVHRGYAYRAWAAGDSINAYQELESKLTEAPAGEEDSLLLLAELSESSGKNKQAQAWIDKVKTLKSRRLSFLKAKLEGNPKKIEALKDQSYLPAEVAFETRGPVKKATAQSNLNSVAALLMKARDYPFLARSLKARRGDLLELLNRRKEAREEWEAVIEKYPKDVETWKKLANSFEQDHLWDEALNAYATAQKGGGLDRQLRIRYAKLLTLRGKIVDALTVLEKAIQEEPKSAELWYEKGRAQLSIYQEDAAKKSFLSALEIDPKYELAILSLGELALSQRLFEVAEEYFNKIDRKSKHYASSLFQLGKLGLATRDFKKAEEFLEKSNKADGRLAEVYPQLVDLYLRNERDREALALVERGARVIPKNVLIAVSKAKIFNFQRKYSGALETLIPYLKTYDHELSVSFTVAESFIRSKDSEKAAEILNRLAAKEVRDPELDYLRAKAVLEDQTESGSLVGSVELASKLISSAIRSEPEVARYRLVAAGVARKMEDRFLAFEHVGHVLETNPTLSEALIVKGDIFIDNGQWTESIKEYDQALKHTRFKSRIYKRLARANRLNGNNKEALRYYEKVIRFSRNDAKARLELGKLYNEEGRFADAFEMLQKAVRANPRLSESHYYLGFINKELGNVPSAIKSFERFLALEPGGVEANTVKDEIFFLKQGAGVQN